jgi:hypothetical protein
MPEPDESEADDLGMKEGAAAWGNGMGDAGKVLQGEGAATSKEGLEWAFEQGRGRLHVSDADVNAALQHIKEKGGWEAFAQKLAAAVGESVLYMGSAYPHICFFLFFFCEGGGGRGRGTSHQRSNV